MIYTDSRSPKVEALTTHPIAEITCYDPRKKLQVRAKCDCRIIQSGNLYDQHQEKASKRATDYSTDVAPGVAADTYGHADEMHFALIEATVVSYDALLLGQPHHRVRYDRANNWLGTTLVP
jgi:hypothetical protein